MFAKKLSEVLFEVEKKDLYLIADENRFKGSKAIPKKNLFYAGRCVFNTEENKILKIRPSNFTFITNKEIIEAVRDVYRTARPQLVYYSNQRADFFINLILSDLPIILHPITKQPYLYSVEIANSYSGRFSPRVTLGLYNKIEDYIIRTDIPAFQGEYYSNEEGLKELELAIKARNEIYFGRELMEGCPSRYQQLLVRELGRVTTLNHLLQVIAQMVNQWLKTNYEKASYWQKRFYSLFIVDLIQ